MGGDSWWFSGHHLDRAIDRWRADHSPIDAQMLALYAWAAAVTESGPTDPRTMPTGNEDEYVSLVLGARVFVTYVAVIQDRGIFVQSVEPDLK